MLRGVHDHMGWRLSRATVCFHRCFALPEIMNYAITKKLNKTQAWWNLVEDVKLAELKGKSVWGVCASLLTTLFTVFLSLVFSTMKNSFTLHISPCWVDLCVHVWRRRASFTLHSDSVVVISVQHGPSQEKSKRQNLQIKESNRIALLLLSWWSHIPAGGGNMSRPHRLPCAREGQLIFGNLMQHLMIPTSERDQHLFGSFALSLHPTFYYSLPQCEAAGQCEY